MSDVDSTQPGRSEQPPPLPPVFLPPSPAAHRRIRPRWHLAVIAATAFCVGGGVAGVATAAVVHDDSGSAGSASSQTTRSQSGWSYGYSGGGSNGQSDGQSYGEGGSSSGLGGSSGTDGSGGGAGDFPQFGDFGQSGGQSQQGDGSGSSGTEGATEDSTSTATDAQSTGLVEITSTVSGGTARGTGMILTSNGVVVTNHHVVEGATSLKVTVVSTGKTYTATYVGGDATADVAVIRLSDASGLTPVDLSDTAAKKGDTITSVGDAGGDGGTLTASPGTVSALDQDITVQDDDGGSSSLSDLMELDAYIVPGDSGGAVLDADGDVVGMNVAASSGSTTVIGYAIPISTVETVAEEIIDGSSSSEITLGYPGYLGVGLSSTSTEATVAEVVDGEAAAKAGIAAGDVITGFDGTTVTSASQLQSMVGKTSPGDKAKVTWQTSSGATKSATVTLGTGPIA